MKPIAVQNRASILRILADGQELSRKRIAQRLGLSEVCVRRWLGQLVSERAVHVCGYDVPPLGGKPAALFALGPEPEDLCLAKPKPAAPSRAHVVTRELNRRRREADRGRGRPARGPAQPHYLMAALYGMGANA